jgi:hypothetical protein
LSIFFRRKVPIFRSNLLRTVLGANLRVQFIIAGSVSCRFHEVLTDFLISALVKFIMEPWVLFNLFKCWPESWIIAEDGLHQIFELSGDVRRFQGGPVSFVDAVGIAMAGLQEMVELIVHFSFTEGEVANYDGKEDDSEGENIGLPSVIFF